MRTALTIIMLIGGGAGLLFGLLVHRAAYLITLVPIESFALPFGVLGVFLFAWLAGAFK